MDSGLPQPPPLKKSEFEQNERGRYKVTSFESLKSSVPNASTELLQGIYLV